MNNLTLTAAFGEYDRTGMLQKGAVRPEGINLRIITLPPIEIFHRMSRFPEFDVSEMSMGTHCHLLGAGDSPFVGMPAFPSRVFRHSMVYVNADAGIQQPEDLNGKRIGIHEWGMTAVVWIIGILREEYGLEPTSVDWRAAIRPRVPIQIPAKTKIRYLETGQAISDMLESGELDAALLHQVPPCFVKGSPRVRRLFPDYKSAEIDYYQRTGIHPIMHCVILRKDIFRQHPWAIDSLYKAFCEARQKVVDALNDNGALFAMIPFLPSVMEETNNIFGRNYWPYGIDANRTTLEKLVCYAYQQGLTPRMLDVDELFAANFRGI
ncbi:MAG: ABC transporter substrate-binding protein [Thermodesulfobacteriota bacterium]